MITGMTITEISKALIYCKHKDMSLCAMCPYIKYPVDCSKRLLDDAAKMLISLQHLSDEKKHNEELVKKLSKEK